jgi:hypothetical protein
MVLLLSAAAFAKPVTLTGKYTTTYDPDQLKKYLNLTPHGDGSLEVRFLKDFNNHNLTGLLSGKITLVGGTPFQLDVKDGTFISKSKDGKHGYNIKNERIKVTQKVSGQDTKLEFSLVAPSKERKLMEINGLSISAKMAAKRVPETGLTLTYRVDRFDQKDMKGTSLTVHKSAQANISNSKGSMLVNNVDIFSLRWYKKQYIVAALSSKSGGGEVDGTKFESKHILFRIDTKDRGVKRGGFKAVKSIKIYGFSKPFAFTAFSPVTFYNNNQEAFRVTKSYLTVVTTSSQYANCPQNSNCLLQNGKDIRIKPQSSLYLQVTGKDYFVDVEPINKVLFNHVKILFGKGKGNKLRIMAENVATVFPEKLWAVMPEEWIWYGNSFRTRLYRKNAYNSLECYHKDMKGKKKGCYLNGKPFKGLNPSNCNRDSDCSKNEFCNQRMCMDKVVCKRHSLNSRSSGPFNLIILGQYEKTKVAEKKFKSDVKKILTGKYSLFETQPIKRYKNKFKVFYVNVGTRKHTFASLDTKRLLALAESCKKQGYVNYKDSYVFLVTPVEFRAMAQSSAVSKRLTVWGGAAAISTDEGIGSKDAKLTFVHEFGHAFGGLDDEYLEIIPRGSTPSPSYPNCAVNNIYAKVWWFDVMKLSAGQVGADTTKTKFKYLGCGGECPKLLEAACKTNIRPSKNSVMNSHNKPGGNKFNKPCEVELTKKLRKG